MRKFIISICAVLAIAAAGIVVLPAKNVAAEPKADCQTHFLGIRAWYDGLVSMKDDGTCRVNTPVRDSDGSSLRRFIWTVVMNVVSMILGAIGYLAIAMVIWGGYQYMLARGDPGKLAKGKKTVTNAVIGMALVMVASLISGAIADVISKSKGGDFIKEIFNTAFVWGGIIAVIMIVWGGIQYVTSVGNPSAAKTARDTILYSSIGLIIVILAAVIVNTVVGAIG